MKIIAILNILSKNMDENVFMNDEYEKGDYKFDARNTDFEVIKGFKNEPGEIKIERVKDNIKKYNTSIKIILIGDCKVGKTSILQRLIDNKFNEKYETSLSLEYSNYTIKMNNFIIRMQIWDTPGQEKYESDSIISNYYKTADVAIFIYAINDLKSYNNINEYMKDFINENKENDDIRKVLLGNKLDLENERKVDIKIAKNFSKKNKFDYFYEITCKNNDSKKMNNIRNIFDSIGRIFYEEYSRLKNSSNLNYSSPDSIIYQNNESLTQEDNDNEKPCCLCHIF